MYECICMPVMSGCLCLYVCGCDLALLFVKQLYETMGLQKLKQHCCKEEKKNKQTCLLMWQLFCHPL